MNKQSKNNSIIFLTTLSVYLGLVLVGGAMSPVLAQAATTKNFNVQDEIEVKDDLDKKPDENLLFAQSLIRLIEKLDQLSREGNFDWNAEKLYEIENFEFCEKDSGRIASYESDGSLNRQVDFEIGNASFAIAENFLAKITKLRIGNRAEQTIDYRYSFGKKSLDFQAKVKFENEKNARIFGSELTNQSVSVSESAAKKIVLENTKVFVENDQVFVVTRLPRGSLDELLKQNAKAEIR